MRHRSTDAETGFTVSRVIPVWGIVLLVLGGVGQAGAIYLGQRDLAQVVGSNAEKQRDETSRLSSRIDQLTAQIETMNRANSGRDMAVLESKMRLDGLDRWRAEVDQARRRP